MFFHLPNRRIVKKSIRTGTAIAMLAVLAVCVSYPSSVKAIGDNCDSAYGQGDPFWFCRPLGIAVDTAGNLYVADAGNHNIRKITPEGEVSVFAGSDPANGGLAVDGLVGGEKGFADGKGSAARFDNPVGIVIDAADHLYVADNHNHRIRKITPEGEVSTLAGGGLADGKKAGFIDGQGNTALFSFPANLAIDAKSNLYVTEWGNQSIRKVTPNGEVSTLAGGKQGFADGQGSAARFGLASGVAIDAAGNLYVADTWNNRIRKVTPEGKVSTLAGSKPANFADGKGSAARFNRPNGIAMDRAGNLYVTDAGNHRIRKVTPKGEVSTFAGGGEWGGFADGQGSAARFRYIYGIAMDAAGTLYVADGDNHRIRKITPQGKVSTLASDR